MIEKNAVEYWIRTGLEKRMRELDSKKGEKRPEIRPIKHNQQSKLERIRAMVDPYARGELTFSPEIKVREKLRTQLFAYPRGNKMDVLDAMAYQFSAIADRLPPRTSSLSREHLDKLMTLESMRPGYFEALIKGTTDRLPFINKEKKSWLSV